MIDIDEAKGIDFIFRPSYTNLKHTRRGYTELVDEDSRKNVMMRLRRIEGQVRGVQRMIEEEADCGEVLNQVAAIKSAVNQVGLLVFENHARDCIKTAIAEDPDGDSLKEIVGMMGRLIR